MLHRVEETMGSRMMMVTTVAHAAATMHTVSTLTTAPIQATTHILLTTSGGIIIISNINLPAIALVVPGAEGEAITITTAVAAVTNPMTEVVLNNYLYQM